MGKTSSASGKIDFIGIGSAKSGSTWVAQCLEEHPEILFSNQKSRKELHFFNSRGGADYLKTNYSNYHKGIGWYPDQFPRAEKGKLRGEFSISYLLDLKAPTRIKKHFPQTKLLVTLRDPVEMIYSFYWWIRATVEQSAPPTFAEAVRQELFLPRGLYYKHLKRYFDLFLAKNIHVILMDDIKTYPKETVRKLYRFLGVSDNFMPTIIKKKINPAMRTRFPLLRKIIRLGLIPLRFLKLRTPFLWSPVGGTLYQLYKKVNLTRRGYPPMNPRLKTQLTSYYRDDIEKLEELINRDLSAWKTP